MTKVSVIANCQSGPIASRLLSVENSFDLVRIPPAHTIAPESQAKTLEKISKADVIVYQRLGPGFGELASANLRQIFPEKTFVSFPSIYFSGTMPQLKYLRLEEGGTLKGPLGDYHDHRLVQGYLDGRNPSCVRHWLDDYNVDAKSYFDQCVAETEARDKGADIQILDVILDRIKFYRTMYTFNHPDNVVLCAIVDRILHKLGYPSGIDAPPPKKPWLGNTVAAVPEFVTHQLGLNYFASDYSVDGVILKMPSLAADFFYAYSEVENFRSIVEYNNSRGK